VVVSRRRIKPRKRLPPASVKPVGRKAASLPPSARRNPASQATRYGRALARATAASLGAVIGGFLDDRFAWVRQVTEIWPALATVALDVGRVACGFAVTMATLALAAAQKLETRVETARARAGRGIVATRRRS
jgi:hypothetical protein